MDIKAFGYQATQLFIFAPVSALVAKTETISYFIPNLDTVFNVNILKEKMIDFLNGTASEKHVQAEYGPLKSFDFNPLSDAIFETVAIAATLAICTATIFQTLRLMPGFKNSPKVTFALSCALSTGALVAASKFDLIPTGIDVVTEVAKNTIFVGGFFTIAAKIGKAGHKYVLHVLNFGDLLYPVKSVDSVKPTITGSRDQQTQVPSDSKDTIQQFQLPPPPQSSTRVPNSSPSQSTQIPNLPLPPPPPTSPFPPSSVQSTRDLPPPIVPQQQNSSSSVQSTKDLSHPQSSLSNWKTSSATKTTTSNPSQNVSPSIFGDY